MGFVEFCDLSIDLRILFMDVVVLLLLLLLSVVGDE
jgi:hypothetical protein